MIKLKLGSLGIQFAQFLVATQVVKPTTEQCKQLLPFVFRRDVSSPAFLFSSSHSWLQTYIHTSDKTDIPICEFCGCATEEVE